MALTAEELKLYDFARKALPSWVRTEDEFLTAAAKMFGSVRAMGQYLFGQALIGTASGGTATTPDWLGQHARDRGTTRSAGESDPELRARLKEIPDALTRASLLAMADAILTAAGIADPAALLELPRDAARFGDWTALTGTGGTFAQSGTTSKFTPDVLPWPTPPYQAPTVEPVISWQLEISGAADAGNDGTNDITGLDGDAAIVTNATGVAGADPTVAWTAQRLDVDGNVSDGFARSYLGRGYRAKNSRPMLLIVIVPFPTTTATALSISRALQFKKAAGIAIRVERRAIP